MAAQCSDVAIHYIDDSATE